MKNSQHMRMYEPKFQLICEAYQVLSNLQHRTIYEQYGEEALRTGIQGPDGSKFASYSISFSFQRRVLVSKQLLRNIREFLSQDESLL